MQDIAKELKEAYQDEKEAHDKLIIAQKEFMDKHKLLDPRAYPLFLALKDARFVFANAKKRTDKLLKKYKVSRQMLKDLNQVIVVPINDPPHV
jgi:hypothetical protein